MSFISFMHAIVICLGVSGAILRAAGKSVEDECKKHGNQYIYISLYIYRYIYCIYILNYCSKVLHSLCVMLSPRVSDVLLYNVDRSSEREWSGIDKRR